MGKKKKILKLERVIYNDQKACEKHKGVLRPNFDVYYLYLYIYIRSISHFGLSLHWEALMSVEKMENKLFKPSGLMPRSIPRTVRRFWQQLQPGSEQKALAEFRVSRYQAIVSVQCLLALICLPLIITWTLKWVCIHPLVEHFWKAEDQRFFLNNWQEHRAILQVRDYADRRIFDQLLADNDIHHLKKDLDGWLFQQDLPFQDILHQQDSLYVQENFWMREDLQEEFISLGRIFHQETIMIITNALSDLCCLSLFVVFYQRLQPQRAILKTFISETLYSFSDTTKAFLVLLITDLLVGYHSPIGWELSLETLIQHFGLHPNENIVFLTVATVPVFLSTIFKYGIFRYLNRVSPSTVAIYYNMIE